MRITQVMLGERVGGVERIVPEMSLSLAEAGHQVQLIINKGFTYPDNMLHPNIHLFAVPMFARNDPIAKWRITRELKKFRPQIAHLHLRKGVSMANKLCKRLSIATCTSMHNYGNPARYDKVDKIMVPTQSLRRHMIDNGIDASKLFLVPNFSRMPVKPVADNYPGKIKLFAFGRFIEKKGFNTLVEAAGLLKQQGIEIQLSLAGSGELAGELQLQITRLDLDSQINLVPWQTDVTSFIDSNDVFILPSFDEPFGLVILEAMARGKPVISSDTSGPVEILNEQTGTIFKKGDATDMSDKIKELLENPEQGLRKAQNAQRVYLEKYTHHSFVPLVEKVYSD